MKIHQLINHYDGLNPNDIILLLEHTLSASYSSLILSSDITFTKEQEAAFTNGIRRLMKNEPIQYILGEWDFIDLKLKVDKRALIPRPETEILALEGADIAKKFSNPKILDAGCGTGCIGLYIKHAVPEASLTLCDISNGAISLARENAELHNLDVRFKLKDLKQIEETYDIIVSNPPYITSEDMKHLDSSVINYEPANALFGGEDGLEFYRILSGLHRNMNRGGYIAVEIGINQSEQVIKLFSDNFIDINVLNDFAGIARVITAKKKN
ncbi:MAG: peptide chain release factor N(5)-glutamine methyltransferase [Clostridia bacterium]|nr:peptide chain release factor N(5)-glutamine methyltransferase [Clostridia bacterium]